MFDEPTAIETVSYFLLRLTILVRDKTCVELLTNCSTDLQFRARELRAGVDSRLRGNDRGEARPA